MQLAGRLLGKQVIVEVRVGHFGLWLFGKTQQTDLTHPCHAFDICGFLPLRHRYARPPLQKAANIGFTERLLHRPAAIR